MRVLFLSSELVNTSLPAFIASHGHEVEREHEPRTDLAGYDLVVSFGYRHLLRAPALTSAKRPPVNLHISYLPYNRGAHPLFWASYESTPVGVTIHEIDEGVDTGPIIAQQLVPMAEGETFATGYAKIMEAIQMLFVGIWPAVEAGTYTATAQPAGGTVHRVRDLPEGFAWDDAIEPTVARLKLGLPPSSSDGALPRHP